MKYLRFILIFVSAASVHGSFQYILPNDSGEITDDTHPHGTPLNIMTFTQNHSITVDYDAIDKIFLNPEIIDRKIVAISIIGAFRKGKSFLMDYFLRFMYANYQSINFMASPLNDKRDWIGPPNSPLLGFSWKAGPHGHTSGVVMWSDVFLHENDDKTEKIAIVLMDTQGLFDPKAPHSDNSRIFALGTLISSMQIFNLNDVIQENQLEYLQMATDYAKFVTNTTQRYKSKPFQNLLFLQRDWAHNEDYSYGLQGGELYLAEVLHIKADQSEDLRNVREFIKSSFDRVYCYLMPHPGLQIINDKNFNGEFSKLDKPFQKHLITLIEWLLESENLKKKRILNAEVTGKDFSKYVKEYFSTFQSPDSPKILSIYEATIQIQFANFVETAMDQFKNALKMYEPKQDSPNYDEELEKVRNKTTDMTILGYKSVKKMGTVEHEDKYMAVLQNEMNRYSDQWMESLLSSHKKMKELQKENERQKQKILEEAEAHHRNVTETLAREQEELKQQIKNREMEVAKNMTLKEKEKRLAIAAIQEESALQQKKANEQMQQLLEQQKAEQEKIIKVSEERAKKTEEEMKILREQQDNKNKMFELQLQADREMRIEIMKKDAEDRKEERRIQQERWDKDDAARKEEMNLLRSRLDEESRLRREELKRQQEEREKEREERQERYRIEDEMRQQEKRQREKGRAPQRAEFNQQMDAVRRSLARTIVPNIVCLLFAPFLLFYIRF